MANRMNLRDVRKAIAAYFGEHREYTLEVIRSGSHILLCIEYPFFAVREQMESDIQSLVGEDYDLQVRCRMSYLDYIACIVRLTQSYRLELIDKLKDEPHFDVWHVNRYCDFEYLRCEEFFTSMLHRMKDLVEHPEKVEIWEIGKVE